MKDRRIICNNIAITINFPHFLSATFLDAYFLFNYLSYSFSTINTDDNITQRQKKNFLALYCSKLVA